MARLGVSVGGRVRKPRAVKDQSAPIPREITSKLGGSMYIVRCAHSRINQTDQMNQSRVSLVPPVAPVSRDRNSGGCRRSFLRPTPLPENSASGQPRHSGGTGVSLRRVAVDHAARKDYRPRFILPSTRSRSPLRRRRRCESTMGAAQTISTDFLTTSLSARMS